MDAATPLARTHALPRAFDSEIERHLDRQLRKLARGWSLVREADPIQIGARMFFPDFTLCRGGDRVLIEVVGYYTEAYLASKLQALRAVKGRPMIVLVDETLACDDRDIPAGAVLRYRGKPDAKAVLDAAEALIAMKPPAG